MASVVQRARQAVKAAVGVFAGDVSPDVLAMMSGVGGSNIRGYPPVKGSKEILDGYSTMPWLRAVSSKISQGVASAEWKLYVTRKTGKPATRDAILQRASYATRKKSLRRKQVEDDAQEIETHPLLTVLNDANGYHTGVGLRKLTQTYLDLVGEAFWIKERGTLGQPVGLWPIPPNWVIGTPTPGLRSYTVSFSGWKADIPDTEVLWFCDLNPVNPYGRGTGTGMALGDELDTDEYASKYTKQFFFNSAKPDFLVYPKSPATLTDGNTRRLEEDWNGRNQGFWKAFKGHFMSKEVGVYEFGGQSDMRALQMIELRKAERDTIIQVFGVSPEMLGVVAGADRAHAEAAEFQFCKHVLVPRLEFLRATLQERLVPEFDERLILDYESPVGEDRDFQLKVQTAFPGGFPVDEWRELADAQPLDADAGKVFLVPSTMRPAVVPGEPPPTPPAPVIAPQNAPKPPAAGTTAYQSTVVKDDVDVFKEAGDADGEHYALKALSDNLDDLPAITRIAARLEPRLRQKFIAAVVAAQGRIDAEQLARDILSGNLAHIEHSAEITSLREAMQGLTTDLRAGYLAGANVAYDALSSAGVGMSFDLVNSQAVGWARSLGSQRITVIMDETRDAVRQIVADAFEQGWDARKTAQMIKDSGLGLNKPQTRAWFNFGKKLEEAGVPDEKANARLVRYAQAQLRQRSMLVARTEMITAANAGQQGLWKDAERQGAIRPDVTRRQWITTPDDRLCQEVCEPMDGQEVGLDEPFITGDGRQVMHPGADSHPNCRCAMALVFKESPTVEEQVGTALAKRKVKRIILRDENGVATGWMEEG